MTYKEAKKTIDEFGLDSKGYPSLKKAIDVVIEALEKQIQIEHHHTIVTVCSCARQSVCPKCLRITITHPNEYPEYCAWCGQAIDWSDM